VLDNCANTGLIILELVDGQAKMNGRMCKVSLLKGTTPS
jgi:hypothetical protein